MKFNKHVNIVQQPEVKLESHDWLKVVQQRKTECKFHNKLLRVVEQHIIALCSKCFPLALTHALRQIRH